MPTSPLYDSIQTALRQRLTAALDSQITTLALVLVGVLHSMSSQLAPIARAMPLDTTHAAKEQRLRRFLDNERITQTDHYHPVIQQALHGLTGQKVQLLIDRVLLHNCHNILVVSLAFRRRSIPLAWCVLPHRGSSSLQDRQALLAVAVARLPPRVRISVHGDSEFRSPAFWAWLRQQGYDGMLGITGQLWVADRADRRDGQRLAQRVGAGRGVTYLQQVYLTQETEYGPVNVLAWWERDDDGTRVLRGAITNLPATARTKALGRRRMWIETVFRDWQSGGFHLDRTGITEPGRMLRLLLVLVLVYVVLVAVGRWVVKRGYRRLVDAGTRHQWQFSLFQLGVGWLQRCHSYHQPFPLIWCLYT